MIKAVVFDLDGLLIDSEPVWFDSKTDFLRDYDLEWTDEDQIKQMGVRTETWAEYTYQKMNGIVTHEKIIEEILGRMIIYYESGDLNILPGADDALKYCSENFIVGLGSGSPLKIIKAALKGASWESYFEEIVSSDEVARGKPEPDTYLETFRRLNIIPEETVILEDSAAGIMAGINSGAKVIAVPDKNIPPSPEILSNATLLLDSLEELPDALNKLNRIQN